MGRETAGQEVDSSAMVRTPGNLPCATSFMRLMKSMAWRFSRPPNWLGTHSRFARVVEVEHGGDSVYAKAVDVVFVEPEERVGDEIVLDFVAAVIVDERAPVGVRALPGVGVFVEMGAVELGEAVSIAGGVRGCPVENDAEAGLVTAVDKFHEFSRCAEAAGGGKVAERLVAPGAVVGMLHDGEQFDVRVAEILDVGDKLVAELAVA